MILQNAHTHYLYHSSFFFFFDPFFTICVVHRICRTLFRISPSTDLHHPPVHCPSSLPTRRLRRRRPLLPCQGARQQCPQHRATRTHTNTHTRTIHTRVPHTHTHTHTHSHTLTHTHTHTNTHMREPKCVRACMHACARAWSRKSHILRGFAHAGQHLTGFLDRGTCCRPQARGQRGGRFQRRRRLFPLQPAPHPSVDSKYNFVIARMRQDEPHTPNKTREDVLPFPRAASRAILKNAEVSAVRRYSCVCILSWVCACLCAHMYLYVCSERAVC